MEEWNHDETFVYHIMADYGSACHTPSVCMSCVLGEPHHGAPGPAEVSPGTQLSLRF